MREILVGEETGFTFMRIINLFQLYSPKSKYKLYRDKCFNYE